MPLTGDQLSQLLPAFGLFCPEPATLANNTTKKRNVILSVLYRLQAGFSKDDSHEFSTGDQPIEINFSSVTRQPVIV